MANRTFSEFLLDSVGLSYGQFALSALDRLAGKQLDKVFFYDSADQVLGFLPSSVPIFFFPFAEQYDDLIGFHLLPGRVDWERLVVARADAQGVREIAPNLPEYVHRNLLYLEALYYEDFEDPAETMQDVVAMSNEAFGDGFYHPGRRGRFWTQDVDAMGFKAAGAVMSSHVGRTYEYVGRGEIGRAARSFVRSMGCYHYTSGLATYADRRSGLRAYFELGRELQAQAPGQFPERVRRELSLSDDAERVAWIVDLWQNGEIKWSLKALCDLCYVRNAYLHPLVYDLLMAHVERLNAAWAAALLESREVVEGEGAYQDIAGDLEEALAVVT